MEKEIIDFLTQYWWGVLVVSFIMLKSIFNTIKDIVKEYNYGKNIWKSVYYGIENNTLVFLCVNAIGVYWIFMDGKHDKNFKDIAFLCFIYLICTIYRILSVWSYNVNHPLNYTDDIHQDGDEFEQKHFEFTDNDDQDEWR